MTDEKKDSEISKTSAKSRRKSVIAPPPTQGKQITGFNPTGNPNKKTALGSLAASVVRTQPKVYSPQFLDSSLNLPRDMRTQNMWNRNFYLTNPLVRTAINMHAAYTVSKFDLECEDPMILRFFEDMLEKLDFKQLLHELSLEYWKLGESIVYLDLDEDEGIWGHGYVHNPDFIRVTIPPGARYPVITLVPDESMKQLVTSANPQDRMLREQISEDVLMYILKGQDIPLENFNVSHIKLLSSPYDPRGTSVITSCYRDLMLFDKIREAKMIQADNMINPLTLIKLGDPNGNFKPTQDDIRQWQEQILDSVADQSYQIITHAQVQIEKISNSGQTLDMNQDLDECKKNILFGLMMPTVLFDQDYGSYANSSVALETLKMRYEEFRSQIKRWVEKKVLEPIAKIQDFYVIKGGKQHLIYPRVKWGKIILRETDSYMNALSQQLSAEPGVPGKVSIQSFLDVLDLDYEAEKKKSLIEIRDQLLVQKKAAAMAQMTIEELETLDPTGPIQDTKQLEQIEKTLDIQDQANSMGKLNDSEPGADLDFSGGDLGGTPDLDLGGAEPSLDLGMESPAPGLENEIPPTE